jgi:phosphopantothenoylcysteine decarboxylase
MTAKPHLLIGASGSVAAIKLQSLVEAARPHFEVQVIVTEAAKHFADVVGLVATLGVIIHTDTGEWGQWREKGDPVLHIDLVRWADVLIIAPLSANTLAKLAHGLADNLLTCVARAWPIDAIARKPIVVAPAMNTRMWEHPFTAKQLATIQHELGFRVVPPITKLLACGDYGAGAMAEPGAIMDAVRRALPVSSPAHLPNPTLPSSAVTPPL